MMIQVTNVLFNVFYFQNVVYMENGQCQCSIVNPNDASAPPKSFSFDSVYYTESTTENIYNEITYPLVEVRTTAT